MLHFLIISAALDGIPVRYALVQYSFKNGVDRANFKAKTSWKFKSKFQRRGTILKAGKVQKSAYEIHQKGYNLAILYTKCLRKTYVK